MARSKAEGVLVFLFGEDVIGRAELLYGGVIKTCAFLHFRCDEESLALGFSHLGLDVTTATYGQCVRRDVSAVKPQDTSDDVPEGGLAVTTASVCNDEGFEEHLTDGCKTADHLHIVDKLPVITKNEVEAIVPYLLALVAGRNGGNLCNEIFGVVFLCAVESFAEIVGRSRSTKEEGVVVKVAGADLKHWTGLTESGGDVLGVAAVKDILVIVLSFDEFVVCFHLCLVHNRLGFCLGGVFQNILTTVGFELAKGGEKVSRSLCKLTSCKLVSHSLGTGFALLPVVFVVTDKMGSGRIAEFV